MAIQMRRGNEADLDISRLQPGELAVCLDTGKVIVKLSGAGNNYLTLTDSTVLAGLISGKADADHSHDDRYYTESEVDALLSGKAGAGHSHDAATTTTSGFITPAEKLKLAGCKQVVTCTQANFPASPDSDTVYLVLEAAS